MERKFLVSTDCAGIMSSAKVWKLVWGPILTDPHCEGVEMIGWRWSRTLINEAYKQGIHVVGIHGRTAGWSEERSLNSKVTMGMLNMVFVSNKELVELGHSLHYILLHRSTITPHVRLLLEAHKDHLPLLVIENVLSQNDFERTLETVNYLVEKGIRTGLTFDLVHFLREPLFEFPQMSRFGGLIHALHEISKLKIPVNIHFPIGTYEGDSLPIDKITSSMWKELSAAMNEVSTQFVVLENQQRRAYSIFLPPWKYAEVAKRNIWVVDFLKDKQIL